MEKVSGGYPAYQQLISYIAEDILSVAPTVEKTLIRFNKFIIYQHFI